MRDSVVEEDARKKWAEAQLMSPSRGARRAPEIESCSCVGMKGLVGCSGWSCWRPWSDVASLNPKSRTQTRR